MKPKEPVTLSHSTVTAIKQAILDAVERKPELIEKVLTEGRLRWPEKLPSSCQK